jgi:hypothetical protein
MQFPPDTFSASEVQHLLDVVADEEGRYPHSMREFAAVLLELLAEECSAEVQRAQAECRRGTSVAWGH